MDRTSRFVTLSMLTAAMLPGVAAAENYFSFAYSYADYDEQDLSFEVAGQAGAFVIDGYDLGSADYFTGAAGMWLSDNFRAELALDISTSTDEDDGVTFSSPFVTAVPGEFEADLTSHTLMVNGYYHFLQNRKGGALDPFVGLGIGLSKNKLDDMILVVPGEGVLFIEEGDSTEFAYKAGAGLGYWLSDSASVDFSVYYVDAGTVEGGSTAGDSGGTVSLSERVEMDLESINYRLGMSLLF